MKLILLTTSGRKFQNKQATSIMITRAAAVIGGLIYVRHWSKCFTYINSFNLHNNSTIIVTIPFYR